MFISFSSSFLRLTPFALVFSCVQFPCTPLLTPLVYSLILSLFQFPCKYCGRGYKNRRVLQLHEASHLARKEFNCHICDYSASRKDLLKAHIKGVHDNERNEICPLCGKRFLVSFFIIFADSSYCNYCRLNNYWIIVEGYSCSHFLLLLRLF